MTGSFAIKMRSGERSDASIAVLATRIAISPYDVVNVNDDDDDDDDELAWGRGLGDKEITYTLSWSGAVR